MIYDVGLKVVTSSSSLQSWLTTGTKIKNKTKTINETKIIVAVGNDGGG